jgi:hypothetical protein
MDEFETSCKIHVSLLILDMILDLSVHEHLQFEKLTSACFLDRADHLLRINNIH